MKNNDELKFVEYEGFKAKETKEASANSRYV